MTHDEANALLEQAHQSQVKLELAHLANTQRRRQAVRAAAKQSAQPTKQASHKTSSLRP